MANITAADAVFMISILPLFPVPQQLQGFMADDAFAAEATDVAETVLGVDGQMSYGWVPRITPMNVHIMPGNPSSDLFDNWALSQDAGQLVLPATATILLNGTGKKYSLSQGVLKSYKAMPDVKRVLAGRTFMIHWASVTVALAG